MKWTCGGIHGKPLSMSTDYEGLVDFAETPVAKMLTATRS